MSDFKKKAAPPEPTDDMAPVPVTPFSIGQDVPAIDEDQHTDDVEANKQAAPYWHPAWATVEDYLREQLEVYKANNALVYKDLPDDEFKIRMTSEAVVAEIITKVMEDVKRAVESVETRPKPAKRTQSGT